MIYPSFLLSFHFLFSVLPGTLCSPRLFFKATLFSSFFLGETKTRVAHPALFKSFCFALSWPSGWWCHCQWSAEFVSRLLTYQKCCPVLVYFMFLLFNMMKSLWERKFTVLASVVLLVLALSCYCWSWTHLDFVKTISSSFVNGAVILSTSVSH